MSAFLYTYINLPYLVYASCLKVIKIDNNNILHISKFCNFEQLGWIKTCHNNNIYEDFDVDWTELFRNFTNYEADVNLPKKVVAT